MTRTLLWLIGGLILGGIIHITAILTLPLLAEETTWSRVSALNANNRMLVLNRVAQGDPNPLHLDPELSYGLCQIDLSEGPAYLNGVLPDAFWSVAVYDQNGIVIYSTTNRDGIGQTVDMGIFNAAQTRLRAVVVALHRRNDGDGAMAEIDEMAGDKDAARAFGRQVAMHVAATNPMALDITDLDQAAVERERAIFSDQARASGKPDNIIEKMVEGRLRKFYEEVCLVKQAFVINPDLTVEKALAEAEKEIGAPAKIAGFVRFALGEGVEKEESDFAAEVAAAAKG